MIGTRRMILMRLCAAALGLLLAVVAAGPEAIADDTAGRGREDVISLQRRLMDAGCYTGAIDGAASTALDAAIKACPDQSPFLRIETGMHTAMIRRIGLDTACRRMATASEDKTVRIWSLPDVRLERTLRLPIGPGDAGKVNTVALSLDGRRLAAGGWDASYFKSGSFSISLVDLDSGSIRRVGSLPDVLYSIAISPDGARVAVGMYGNNGVRVYDWATGAELFADRDYADTVYGLTFAPDGSLIASSWDGQVRRYGPDLRLAIKRGGLAGQRPYGVAIDHAGRRLAVGFNDAQKISILDAASLAPIVDVDAGVATTENLNKVAWSRDGETLIAGGNAQTEWNGAWRDYLRPFDEKGLRRGHDIPISLSTVMDLRTCGDGFAYAAADPTFGLIGPGGLIKVLQAPHSADMRSKIGKGLQISNDGETVRFGLDYGDEKPVVFDVAAGSLADSPAVPVGMKPARVDGLPVTDWQDRDAPKFKGGKIALDDHETARSLAILPDGSGFALGAEWHVRAFNAMGRQIWAQTGPGVAWGIDFSADGQVLVVAYSDGTIRWLRGSDGKELLALFVDVPTRRWVAWTPTGYYMASPGGEDLIGWHLNRGWTQEADFFPASRFSARFNRPDIVQLVLKTRDEAAALRQATDTAKRKRETAPIETTLPPVIKIDSPTAEGKFSGDSVEVTFSVRSPSGLPIERIDALIDGRPVEARGVAPAASQTGDQRHLSIPAPAHDFELGLVARSGALASEVARVRLVYAGAPAVEQVLKPKLYAVTIGVSDYVDPGLRLGYAADDARGFAAVLLRQKGGLYSDVQVKTLADREVTRASVVEALDWLGESVTARDVAMVLIAGHGVTDEKQNYWFLPADVSMKHLSSSAVSQDDILRAMRGVYCKAILFLDTCHANQAVNAGGVAARGPVDVNSIVNELAKTENGLIVFSSSQGRELSGESAQFGHGNFTEALIEGLDLGKADLLHKGVITVSGLDAWIADRVKQLTEGHQHPVMSRPSTVPDFAFAVAR
jgi:WD40 repeat protein